MDQDTKTFKNTNEAFLLLKHYKVLFNLSSELLRIILDYVIKLVFLIDQKHLINSTLREEFVIVAVEKHSKGPKKLKK